MAIVTGLVIAGWRGARSVYWWRQWGLWRSGDPSGAELYELNFRIEAALALLGLAVPVIGVWLLRRLGRRPR